MTTDPLYKYLRPPLEAQPQGIPGKTGKMTPEPDHGEESYKGSGRLSGKAALITGGRLRHRAGKNRVQRIWRGEGLKVP